MMKKNNYFSPNQYKVPVCWEHGSMCTECRMCKTVLKCISHTIDKKSLAKKRKWQSMNCSSVLVKQIFSCQAWELQVEVYACLGTVVSPRWVTSKENSWWRCCVLHKGRGTSWWLRISSCLIGSSFRDSVWVSYLLILFLKQIAWCLSQREAA